MMRIYVESGLLVINRTKYPPGVFQFEVLPNDYVDVRFIYTSNSLILGAKKATDLRDQNGAPYADVTALFIAVLSVLTPPVSEASTALSPTHVTGEYLVESDIAWNLCDFDGWTGEPRDLFRIPSDNRGITSTLPGAKSFKLVLLRTRTSGEFGLGGAFRNLRVDAVGSGGKIRGFLDLSGESEPDTSYVYKELEFSYNELILTFDTAESVTVSNLILKDRHSHIALDLIEKWGANYDVSAIEEETVCVRGGEYDFTPRDAPEQYYISSDNVADVQSTTLNLVGVNASGRAQAEDVTVSLNGTNAIPVPSVWLSTDVNRVSLKGSANNGTVYVYADTTVIAGVPQDLTKVRAQIPPGGKRTQQAVFRAPEFDQLGRKVLHYLMYSWGVALLNDNNRDTIGTGLLKVMETEDAEDGAVTVDLLPLSTQFDAKEPYNFETPFVVAPGSRVFVNVKDVTRDASQVIAKFKIKPVTL